MPKKASQNNVVPTKSRRMRIGHMKIDYTSAAGVTKLMPSIMRKGHRVVSKIQFPHSHTHTDRQRHTHTHTQTDIHTQTETHTQTYKHTQTETHRHTHIHTHRQRHTYTRTDRDTHTNTQTYREEHRDFSPGTKASKSGASGGPLLLVLS